MAVVATYSYDPATVEARKEILDQHLAFIGGLEEAGTLLAVGRLGEASVDILFLLNAADAAEALRILAEDPYNRAGYVSSITAHEWSPTRGRLAPL
ncbi:YciI family protein [Microbacterium sp. No. 7]|uniref:YciI family protein n=1 Tax=Microbacterium sp. No. 7 TaxID=1714373 RepID=UPI0006D2AE9B|nr:YciI family protein [Microbacterium sp. No. 7]ALJ18827.1 hypothetical protein AOA12_02425 [Microbacterium sp. No. 7]